MKVLVTGARGTLGRPLVKQLLKLGFSVRSFSRSWDSELEKWGVEQKLGDIKVFSKINSAIEGVEAVFHCAARAEMFGAYKEFYETNFVGTQNVVKSMEEQNVSYLVYTSTPSVVFNGEDICGGDESLPYSKNPLCDYAKTKIMAEKHVMAAKLKVACLRPHLIFGPEDTHMIPKLVDRARKKKLFKIGNGKNLVDVTTIPVAVNSHVLALEKLKEGVFKKEVFFIGQEKPVNLWDFIQKILGIYNLELPNKVVSPKMAYWGGRLLEKGAFIFRDGPPMTRFVAQQLSKSHYFSHAKAKRLLGMEYEWSVEDGLNHLQSQNRGTCHSSEGHL